MGIMSHGYSISHFVSPSAKFLGAYLSYPSTMREEKGAVSLIKSVSPLSKEKERLVHISTRTGEEEGSRRPRTECLPIMHEDVLYLTADTMEDVLGSASLLPSHDFVSCHLFSY